MLDKMMIWGSVLGTITLSRDDFYFQVGNKDGTWDWEKVNDLLWNISNRGANGFREFGPWIDRKGMEKLSPFYFGDGGYNLDIFNEKYFENLEKLVQLAEKYNLDFCIDILNSSETRVEGVKEWTPWKRNIQNLKNYFYDSDASVYRKLLTVKYIFHLNKYPNVYYQICNEPAIKGVDYLLDVYVTLIQNKIKPERILTGLDPLKKNLNENGYDKFYRDFRNGIKKLLGVEAESWVKTISWSALHKASVDNINTYFNENLKDGESIPSNASRSLFYSDDGLRLFYLDKYRPQFSQTYDSTMLILKTKTEAFKREKIGREVIIGKRESEVYGEVNDELKKYKGLEGTIAAYKDFTGVYPENFGKFPQKLSIDWLVEKPVEDVPVINEEIKKNEEEIIMVENKKNFFEKLSEKTKWIVSSSSIGLSILLTLFLSKLFVFVAVGITFLLFFTGIIKK